MKKVIYLTTSLFPEGQAYSVRVIGFAALFKSLGYSVHVIADSTRQTDIVRNKIYTFDYGTYEISGKNGRLSSNLTNKYFAIAALKKQLSNSDACAVVANASSDRFNDVLLLCHKNGVKLILEVCEWYDVISSRLGLIDYRNYRMNRMMEKGYSKADSIIAISRYLEQHFSKRNNIVIRIPTIFDTQQLLYTIDSNNQKIVLVHAGSSVIHKEKFKHIMMAIQKIGKDTPIEYRIYGSSRDIVLKNIDGDDALLHALGEQVKIMGTIPQAEVNKAYQQADFSIFMRDRKCSTSAGFPTKLAESMAAGTPVIANDTGDIGLYLKDGYNGFLINDNSIEEIESTLRKVISLSSKQKKNMRENARKTAEASFDYRSYIDIVKELFKD